MIKFLENLDTKIAVYQLGENNEKGLLDTAKAIFARLKSWSQWHRESKDKRI